jgi:hypothetical protein
MQAVELSIEPFDEHIFRKSGLGAMLEGGLFGGKIPAACALSGSEKDKSRPTASNNMNLKYLPKRERMYKSFYVP